MEFKGVFGAVYRFCEWITRITIVNILWLLCSFPIFYIGINAMFVDNMDDFMAMAYMMTLLSPLFLFPATAALFASARKWVTGHGDAPIFKTFFRAYKENYKYSLFGGLLVLAALAVFYLNYQFYAAMEGTLWYISILFITLMILLFTSLFYYFSILVHFHMTFWQMVKNSVLLTIGQPLTSLMMILSNATILYVSFEYMTFLIPFFTGSLVAAVTFWNFHRIYSKIQEREQAAKREGTGNA